MCAIFGFANVEMSIAWLNKQTELALVRGKDLTFYDWRDNATFFHTRLATNNSPDTYPIQLGGDVIAMNGIVHEATYEKLKQTLDVGNYTVDTAYLLKQLQVTREESDRDEYDFSTLDTLDYVFAFWLLHGDELYLANKDFPLYISQAQGGLQFSSFSGKGFEPLGNRVLRYNLATGYTIILYSFENTVY